MKLIPFAMRHLSVDRILEFARQDRPATFWVLIGGVTIIILQCVIKIAYLAITGKGTV